MVTINGCLYTFQDKNIILGFTDQFSLQIYTPLYGLKLVNVANKQH